MVDDHDDQSYAKLIDRILNRVPDEPPPGFVYPEAPPIPIVPTNSLGALVIQGLGSSSDETDREHFHMAAVVAKLRTLDIPYQIFSYRGPHERSYGPWDTKIVIAQQASTVGDFVRSFGNARVLILAHSQGGCLAAHWICNERDSSALDRLAGLVLFASPIRYPVPSIVLPASTAPAAAQGHVMRYNDIMRGYNVQPSELVARLRKRVTVVRCWHDPMATPGKATFLTLDRRQAPYAEIVLRDATHPEICNVSLSLRVIEECVATA